MRFIISTLLLLVSQGAYAEMFRVETERQAYLRATGEGMGWQYGIYAQAADVELALDLDWDAGTMAYGDFRLDGSTPIEFMGHRTYPVGPGQTERVDVWVVLGAFLLESSGGTVASIAPAGGDAYTIDGPVHPIGGPLTLAGSYTVTGPTEIVQGACSVTFESSPALSYGRLLTSMYPQQVDLLSGGSAAWSGGGQLFTAVVDGYSVDVGLSSMSYDLSTCVATRVVSVPEPATLVLLALALLAWCPSRRTIAWAIHKRLNST